MSYPKIVATAIGMCLIAWIGWNVVQASYAIVRVSNAGATGFGFVLRGALEGLLTSILLGWLAGTVWYFLRRR